VTTSGNQGRFAALTYRYTIERGSGQGWHRGPKSGVTFVMADGVLRLPFTSLPAAFRD